MARSPLLGVDPTRKDTAPAFALGTFVEVDGVEYIYLQASAAVAASVPCVIATGGQVVASGNAGQIHCVATTASLISEYGWYVTRGEVVAYAATSTAAGAWLNVVTDASGYFVTAAVTVPGRATCLIAESGGFATVRLH